MTENVGGHCNDAANPEGECRMNKFADRITGKILPAVPVPLSADGRIHRAAQGSYVRYMASQKVGGVAVWAHTGRGLHLERDVRLEVMKSWREGFSDGRVIIAGVGALPDDSLNEHTRIRKFEDDTMRMAEDAVELGADAFLVYAPVIYRDRPDQDERVIEYHRRIAGLGVPIVLFYLYREAGGISYSPETLDQLMRIPETCAIKLATLDSVTTYQDVSRMLREKFPNIALITGEDRMLGYTIMRGGVAALIGMGSACTAPQVELMDAYFNGDAGRFIELTNQIDDFAELTFSRPLDRYIVRMLWVLAIEGVIPEDAVNDVLGLSVPAEEVKEIAAVMKANGWI